MVFLVHFLWFRIAFKIQYYYTFLNSHHNKKLR
jgi:hypothetical protein